MAEEFDVWEYKPRSKSSGAGEPPKDGEFEVWQYDPSEKRNRGREPEEEPIGLLNEGARSFARGVNIGVPQALGKGLQWMDPDGGTSAIAEAGKALETFGDRQEKKLTPIIKQSEESETAPWYSARKMMAEGPESMATSVVPMIAGLGTAAVAGPIAGSAAGLATLGTMFYGGSAETKYREAKGVGLSDDDAKSLANWEGGIEAGGEIIADLIPLKLFGLAAKPLKGQIIKSLTAKEPVKQIFKNIGKTILGEETTEIGQALGQTYANKQYGVDSGEYGENVADVIGPTLFMSLFFGGAGTAYNSSKRKQITRVLSDPESDQNEFESVLKEVGGAVHKVDPELAKQFVSKAQILRSQGKPVVLNDDSFYSGPAAETESENADPDIMDGIEIDPATVPAKAPKKPKITKTGKADLLKQNIAESDFVEDAPVDQPSAIQSVVAGDQESAPVVGPEGEDIEPTDETSQLGAIGQVQQPQGIDNRKSWQMRKSEYVAANSDPRRTSPGIQKQVEARHEKLIMEAWGRGEEIAPEVLQDYPELSYLFQGEQPQKDTRNPVFIHALPGFDGPIDVPYYAVNPIPEIPEGRTVKNTEMIIKPKGKKGGITSYRLSLVETPEGESYVHIEKGKEERGTFAGVDVKYDAMTNTDIESDPWLSKQSAAFYKKQTPEKSGLFSNTVIPEPAIDAEQAPASAIGQILNDQAGADTEALPETSSNFNLPSELSKIAPRYGYKNNNFILSFQSDMDRAAYTLSQATKNKAHDRILKALQDQTGLSEQALVEHGNKVRDQIKQIAKDRTEGGEIQVSAIAIQKGKSPNDIPQETAPPESIDSVAEPQPGTDAEVTPVNPVQPVKETKRQKAEREYSELVNSLTVDQRRHVGPELIIDAPESPAGQRVKIINKLKSYVEPKAAAEIAGQIDAEAQKTETSPTEAQIEAGNYKKGHINLSGLDITVENPHGSTRSGTDQDGKKWETTMSGHYGYFKRTEGKDGDHVDVVVAPTPNVKAPNAYIVDQVDPKTGKFDEHKIIMGVNSMEEADTLYHSNYEKGWKGAGAISEIPLDDLKEWLSKGKRRAPYAKMENNTLAASVVPEMDTDSAAGGVGLKSDVVFAYGENKGLPVYGQESDIKNDIVKIKNGESNAIELRKKYGAAVTTAMQKKANDIKQAEEIGGAVEDYDVVDLVNSAQQKEAQRRAKKQIELEKEMAESKAEAESARNNKVQVDRGYKASVYKVSTEDSGVSEVSVRRGNGGRISVLSDKGAIDLNSKKIGLSNGENVDLSSATDEQIIDHVMGISGIIGIKKTSEAQKTHEDVENDMAESRRKAEERSKTKATPPPSTANQPVQPEPGKAKAEPPKSSIDADIDELLAYSNQVATDLEAEEKKTAAQAKIQSGLDKIKAGAAAFNELFGEKGTIGDQGEIDPEKWIKAKAALDLMWEGFKETSEGVKEAAKAFIKSAMSALSSKGKPYIDKYIREDIKEELAKEKESGKIEAGGNSYAENKPKAGTADNQPGSGGMPEPLEAVSPEDGQGTESAVGPDTGSAESGGSPKPGDRNPGESGSPIRDGGRDDAEPVHNAPGGRGGKRGSAKKPGVQTGEGSKPSGEGSLTQQTEAAKNDTQAAVDYKISPSTRLGEGGQKTKYKNNVAAIRLLKDLLSAGRTATPAEQDILARYVGWGGIAQAFDESNPKWSSEYKELKAILTPEEWATAVESTQYAHYTSEAIIQGTYEALNHLGFNGGKALEPGAGVGNFMGLMPDEFRGTSRFTAIERDKISGHIAKFLYPNQNVQIADFAKFEAADGTFDLVVGNPPFSDTPITDLSGRKHLSGLHVHNYFFAKAVDLLRENGILAMVVSNSFLDAKHDRARKYIGDRTEFLGAIRLPNNAFLKNAGTEVTTDIVFLRKLADKDASSKKSKAFRERWETLSTVPDALGGAPIPINKYFAENPHMMLGEMNRSGSMYRADSPALVSRPGDNLISLLYNAVRSLPENVFTSMAAQNTDVIANEMIVALNDSSAKVGNYYTDGEDVYRRIADVGGEGFAVKVTEATKISEKRVLGPKGIKRIKALVELRKTVRRQLSYETAGDDRMTENREILNRQYDDYVKAFDHLNSNGTRDAFKEDPDYPLLMSLEHKYKAGISKDAAKKEGVKPIPPSAKKAPIFKERVVNEATPLEKAETPQDALMLSLSERGLIDPQYIGGLLGKDGTEVLAELAGAENPIVFLDPQDGYVTAEAYLSGNVKKKLKQALAAGMVSNARALEKVLPEDIPAHEILVKIGAHWVPKEEYAQFAESLLGAGTSSNITYIPVSGTFASEIQAGDAVLNETTYGIIHTDDSLGTMRMTGSEILSAILAKKEIKVGVWRDDENGNRKFYKSKEATDAAMDKVQIIKDKFAEWLFNDVDRSDKMVRVYNDLINTDAERKFDGSNLRFVGKVPDSIIKFRKHQRDAISRIIQNRQALLDHVVGSGKTFTVIGAIMESKRMGLSHKPMITVPNHLVQQWAADFYRLYPGANILAATKKDFQKENRKKLLAKIATGNWDAVIIAHSQFGFIKADPDFEIQFNQKTIDEINQAMLELAKDTNPQSKQTVKQLQKRAEKLKNKIAALRDKSIDDLLDFGQLGVDSLYVDEAHMFKNLMYITKMQNVRGLSNPDGSQRAYDMFVKVNQIYQKNGAEKGVVFATGTPISNSLAEMYHTMRYMAPSALRDAGHLTFDAWANTFADVEQVWMQSLSGEGYKATNRMSSFVNVDDMLKLYHRFADTVTTEDVMQAYSDENDGARFPIPPLKGGRRTPRSIERSQAQADYMEQIAARAKALEERKGRPQKGEDNMLSIMTDARKCAMDIRLVDFDITEREKGGRLDVASDVLVERYHRYADHLGTQLVFSDMGTPKKHAMKELKELNELQEEAAALTDEDILAMADLGDEEAIEKLHKAEEAARKLEAKGRDWHDAIKAALRGFSIYDDLKASLIEKGIPENEIAFIHDYNTDIRKAALFKAVNEGKIRILIGSTEKMGAGTNVQERVTGELHLDVPWKPSDVEQREGRVVRQGNVLLDLIPNFEVEIDAFATQDTLDLFMWQVQEKKLAMIAQLRSGKVGREIDNAFEELQMSSGEMQAAATSNPYLLQEIQVKDKIKKLERKRRSYDGEKNEILRRKRQAERDIQNIPERIALNKKRLIEKEKFIDEREKTDAGYSATVNGETISGGQAIRDKVKGFLKEREETINIKKQEQVWEDSKTKASEKEIKSRKADLKKLKAGEKVHWQGDKTDAEAIAECEADIKKAETDIKESESNKAQLEKQIQEVRASFAVTFDGTEYKQITKLTAAVKEAVGSGLPIELKPDDGPMLHKPEEGIDHLIKKVAEAVDAGGSAQVGTLAGHQISIDTAENASGQTASIDIVVSFDGNDEFLQYNISSESEMAAFKEGRISESIAESLLYKAISLAQSVSEYQISYDEQKLRDAKTHLETIEKQSAAGEWPGYKELEDAREEHRQILKQLSGLAKAKEDAKAGIKRNPDIGAAGFSQQQLDDTRLPGTILFQRNNTATAPASDEWNRMALEVLEKAGHVETLFLNDAEFDSVLGQYLEIEGKQQSDEQEIAAFYSPMTDKIYIKKSAAKKDTFFHEQAHPVTMKIEKDNPQFYQQGLDLAEKSPYYQQAIDNGYKAGKEAKDEALVQAIGEKGAQIQDAALRNQFVAWLKKLYFKARQYFKKAFGKDITLDDYVTGIAYGMRSGKYRTGSNEGGVKFQKISDTGTINRLESGKKIKAFRAMQLIDGKLYPPMSAKVNGELREPTDIGQWEKADENPEFAVGGKFKLDKANKSSITAAYNPYFHTSPSPLNDQFSSAYNRPNLVTVEVEIPASELTSGYKADGAKDSVGEKSWHTGPVSSKLSAGKKRTVILSRYAKVTRIVPDSEVAGIIAKTLEGENVVIPENVVTPSLKEELIKQGLPVIGKGADIRMQKTAKKKADDLVDKAMKPGPDELMVDGVLVKIRKTKDMGKAERVIRPPQWIAKRFPKFAKMFERQQVREKERSKHMAETLKETHSLWSLNDDQQAELSTLIFSIENRKIKNIPHWLTPTASEAEVKAWFDRYAEENDIATDDVSQADMGKLYIEQNPEAGFTLNDAHYEAMGDWVRGKGASEEVIESFLEIRRSLDKDLVEVWNKLKVSPDVQRGEIAEYRSQILKVTNYFPHKRYGSYSISIIDPKQKDPDTGKPKLLYYTHFESKDLTMAMNARKELADIFAEHPEYRDYKISVGKVTRLSEEVYETPIPVAAIEQILSAAAERITDPSTAAMFRDMLPEATADELKARGWASHAIHRNNVPGYETENLKRALFDYKSGLYGWLTKMDAAKDFSKMLAGADAKREPVLYGYMKQYSKDMLENSDDVDRLVGNMKAVFFAKYLGGNLKTAALNLSQNIIAGAPRLGMEIKGSAYAKWFEGAMKQIRNQIAGSETAFNEDEARLLYELYDEGTTQANYTDEVMGQFSGGMKSAWDKAIGILGYPMLVAERFNRSSLALAAFKAARAGQINNPKTLEALGLSEGQAATYEQAKKFAEGIVLDAHFAYGKGNRPEMFRGSAGAKLMSSAYTFRTFTHNLINLWEDMYRNGGRGRVAILKSLAATVAIGGMASIPLYKTLMHVIRQATGDDWGEDYILGMIPDGADWLRDMLMYGFPSLLGVNMGGSVGMELPVFDKIQINDSWVKQLSSGTFEFVGIPGAILQDAETALTHINAGRYGRGVEVILPAGFANILKGYRMHTEGQHSASGKPVVLPGEREPRKIGTAKMVGQMFGFQPIESAKGWDLNSKLSDFQAFKSGKQGEFADRMAAAKKAKDWGQMKVIGREIAEWNKEQRKAGRFEYIVDIKRALKARMEGRQPPKYLKRRAMELKGRMFEK